MKKLALSLLLACFVCGYARADLQHRDVFKSGEGGYHTYRIPALIVTKSGSLLAFAEGRKHSRSDTGDIDILLKRSTDGGKTWEAQKVIWDDGANTCGNPCPVVDAKTGTIWLALTHNLGTDHEKDIKSNNAAKTRTVWMSQSRDDGKTWAAPTEITAYVKDAKWGWYATGPGVGIQIQNGPHKGRMIIPSDHSYQTARGEVEFGSHSFHSDDGGKTWVLGGSIRPKMNECQVVELADGKGTLLMNMRSYLGDNRRAHSISYDGGLSWSDPKSHPDLVEPICQASILRYTWPNGKNQSRIIFSNPAHEKRRLNMTVRLSYDEGKSWPVSKSIFEGASGYSSLAALPGGDIACLYERGKTNTYETIALATFSLDWLSDGKDFFPSHLVPPTKPSTRR